jgi:hypothetical protein
MKVFAGTVGLVALLGTVAVAQQVEVSRLGGAQITLHLHDFLQPDELVVLRLVATDANALSVFVPEGTGFAALAASPDDGFIRDGAPVGSAVAISGVPDGDEARARALAGCEAKKAGQAACVIVLDIAPAG